MNMDNDRIVLELTLASIPREDIRQRMGYENLADIDAALARALGSNTDHVSVVVARDLEVMRIESLWKAIYPKALKADLGAVEKCMRLSEQRLRLMAMNDSDNVSSGITAAFDEVVEHLVLTDTDGAVVAAGRAIAKQIDMALLYGVGQEVTKALYLVPHLMNTLTALGATPQARATLETAVTGTKKVTVLEQWRSKKSG